MRDGVSVPCKIICQLINCMYSDEMWARFTFITGPWIRLILLSSPQTPPCNVPGIHCPGIVVFWCILQFSVTLVQGTGCFTDESWDRCSLGWCCISAPSLGAQECLTRTKHCNLSFLGHSELFGLPLPALMAAAMCTLIFVLFLNSILLCATWSDVSCSLWWDTVPQNGEKRCQQGSFPSCSPAELCRQKDGFFQPLLQGTGFNEHNVQRAHCAVEMSQQRALKRFREFMNSTHPQWT